MILMLSPWHTLTIVAVFLSLSAFLCAVGILWLLAPIVKPSPTDKEKREKRSAAATRGWETRKRILDQQGVAPSEDEVDRVLRQIDAQAKARGE